MAVKMDVPAKAMVVGAPFTIKVEPAAELKPYIRMLIYGGTGVGKTYLACSACEVEAMSPVLLLDLERGHMTVAGWENLDVLVIPHEAPEPGDQFGMALIERGLLLLQQPDNPYKTVVIDGLTELHYMMMQERLGFVGRNSADWYVPELQDWLHVTNRMRRLLRKLTHSQLHVILTALDQDIEDTVAGGKEVHTKINIAGKLAYEVGAQFDIIGYLRVRILRRPTEIQTNRILQTQPFSRRAAKDRSGRLPVELTDPTMAEIHELVVGQQAEAPAEEVPQEKQQEA